MGAAEPHTPGRAVELCHPAAQVDDSHASGGRTTAVAGTISQDLQHPTTPTERLGTPDTEADKNTRRSVRFLGGIKTKRQQGLCSASL